MAKSACIAQTQRITGYRAAAMELQPRDDVPNIGAKAREIVEDLRDDAYGSLDAINTMAGLTEDDLIALVIALGRRVVELER